MLRIHFAGEDLGRTRLATGPDPMWDVLLSLHKLADRDGAMLFDPWRRRVRDELPPSAHWLLGIAPPRGYSPDFLTPGAASLDEGLDLVGSTPPPRIRADLTTLAAQRPLRADATALAEGSRSALRRLTDAIRCYHHVAVAPLARRVRPHVQADLAERGRTLLHTGVEKTLADLHPRARWQPPVLELPYAADHDLHLEGRGLLLVPSFFCWKGPITLKEPGARPVLVFPIERDRAWAAVQATAPSSRSLTALLGRTRAVILAVLATEACTTTQLAQRTGVSIATASQHASVLRNAGLITTCRVGARVIHAATPSATTLLDGAQ